MAAKFGSACMKLASTLFVGYEIGSKMNNKDTKEVIHINDQVKAAITDESVKSLDVAMIICIVVFVVVIMFALIIMRSFYMICDIYSRSRVAM